MTTALQGMAGGRHDSTGARFGRGTAWLLLALLLVATIFPFYWTLRTGLVSNTSLLESNADKTVVERILPDDPTTVNFRRVLGQATDEEIQEATGRANSASFDYLTALQNSIIIATVIAVAQVFFSSLAAYAFARLRFPGRDKLFFLYLTGLMIPPIFVLIPNLLLILGDFWLFDINGHEFLDWIPGYDSSSNTFLLGRLPGVIAPFFLMSPFAVFFLRQFFLGISRSLEEAALIDGASHFRIFRSIILPIARPQMITLGVLTYITAWNEFLWPLAVTQAFPDSQPLTVALGVFTTQQPGLSPDWSGLMSGTLLAALPVIIIFMFFGKRLVDNIQFSGLK